MEQRRRLRATLAHLRGPSAAATEAPEPPPTTAEAPTLPYHEDHSPESIVEALKTTGCALLKGVFSKEDAARLAAELAGYEPGGEAGREDLMRSDPVLADLARPGQLGGDLVDWGASGSAELLCTLFQRDPCWLQLVDPSPVIEAMDMALGEACHLVNQKGWRNHPGHNAHGSFHADEIFVELPEELAADPRYEPAIHIVTALNYLVDIDSELCPTWVIPETFRSGRRPEGGEWSWRGKTPLWVEAKAGDTLLFRSEVRAPLKPFFSAAESDVRCCVRCGTAAGRMPPRTGTATSARLCTALAKWRRNSGRIPASSWRRRRATRPRIASSDYLESTLSPTTAKKLCPRRPCRPLLCLV